MTRNTTAFIGIDGGGTHSFAIAVDSTGRMLAAAEAGSLNFFGAGLPAARRHLKKLSESLERRLHQGDLLRRHIVLPSAWARPARLVTPSLA